MAVNIAHATLNHERWRKLMWMMKGADAEGTVADVTVAAARFRLTPRLRLDNADGFS
jgi:hypothetical protein